jgi:hypothetical protein
MKKISILSAALLMVIVFTAMQSCKPSGKASTSKLLKFNLEKGKGYDYEIIWDMDQKIMGQQSQISIAGIYALKVTDDSAHIKSLTGTYRSFKMNMKMMGMEIDIDTDKPSPALSEEEMKKNPMGMMNRVFSGIIGKSFIMKVDEEGNVLEVSGFQEMLQGMADSMGANEDMRDKIAASLKDQFNEQTIKDQFAQIFTIFPNKEIKTGDSWEKIFSIGGKMPAKYHTTYTVKEIEGDNVTLATKSRIESDGGDVEVKGNQTGEMIIDSKSGLMINGSFNQELDTKVQGMSMTISGRGKIKGKAN